MRNKQRSIGRGIRRNLADSNHDLAIDQTAGDEVRLDS
jgi:hypothetical protein